MISPWRGHLGYAVAICAFAFPALALLLAVAFFSPAAAATRDLSAISNIVIPQIGKPTFTLTQSVKTAIKNFPSIRAAKARVRAARSEITLAKTAYLPNFDIMAQEIRTTTNVVAGTILPQTYDVIPMQTGTQSHSSSFKSVFANNVGANFSWELYDFGLRGANVQLARADFGAKNAAEKLTELDAAYVAADNYLSTVQYNEVIRANQATVDRMKAWDLVVHTLVDNGLRPGVDSSRADADLAFAKIALIESERATELARVDLSESMGVAGTYITVVGAPLIRRPEKVFNAGEIDLASHPLAVLRQAEVKTVAAKVHVLDRTWYPRFWLHSAMWGRGSGLRNDPRYVAGGTLPQTANWAVGLTMGFRAFEIFEVKAKRQIEVNNQAAARADYDLAIQILAQKDARAKVLLEEARRIAEETPALVKAARDNEVRALERYKVGLTDIVEVAEAERILARAEVEDAVAWVRVWRAILATAYVQGNLSPFLNLVAQAEARTQ